jgi:glycerol-3-phosphate O-acyltransferase
VLPVPLVASVFVEHAEQAEQAEETGRAERAAAGSRTPHLPDAALLEAAAPGSLSLLELKAAAWRRMTALEAAGARVYVPRRDQDYAIEAGLRVLTLGHLVDERDGLYSVRAEELPLLRYYANSIAHLAAGGAAAELGQPASQLLGSPAVLGSR